VCVYTCRVTVSRQLLGIRRSEIPLLRVRAEEAKERNEAVELKSLAVMSTSERKNKSVYE